MRNRNFNVKEQEIYEYPESENREANNNGKFSKLLKKTSIAGGIIGLGLAVLSTISEVSQPIAANKVKKHEKDMKNIK